MDLKNFDTIFTNEKLNESLESLNTKIQFVILNIKRFHL